MAQERPSRLGPPTGPRVAGPTPGLGEKKESTPEERLILKEPAKPTPFPKERVFGIEVAGIWDIGKTHMGATFPGLAMVDTEKKGDIVMRKFDNPSWYPVRNMSQVRQAVLTLIKDPKVKTIMFDSGSDLTDYAAAEYLKETGKEKIFPIVLWSHVYDRVDELTALIRQAGKYIVATSRMKDEYVGDEKTGKLIRTGYTKFPYQLEINLMLEYGITSIPKGEDKPKTFFSDRIFGRVVKNNYWRFEERKPYLFDLTFEGIENELLKPWDRHKDIVKAAEEFIIGLKQRG